MSSTDLLFDKQFIPDTNLVFGQAGSSSTVNINASLSASIESNLSCHFELVHDNLVYRGVCSDASSSFQEAIPLSVNKSVHHGTTKELDGAIESHHEYSDGLFKSLVVSYYDMIGMRDFVNSKWKDLTSSFESVSIRNNALKKYFKSIDNAHQESVSILNSTQFRNNALGIMHNSVVINWRNALFSEFSFHSKYSTGKRTNNCLVAYWQDGRKPNLGAYVKPPEPIVNNGYIPPRGDSVHLLFQHRLLLTTDLIFGMTQYVPSAIIVPIRRVYPMINNVTLNLVSDNSNIHCFDMNMSIDVDTWTWGFSAKVPVRELNKVKSTISGQPAQVKASINGSEFIFLIESIRRTRNFGEDGIEISGRGKSALLSDPYAPAQSFSNTIDRTAQQLMNDVLTVNNVPIGWSIEWGIDDWLVPSGVFSHQGTYMSALKTIADSVGALIRPNPTLQTLSILPKNKYKPWELNSSVADIDLPDSAVVTESIEWVDRAKYNAVYVSGIHSTSKLAQVKRTGTSGDSVAPMVVDALITNEIAARQRGIYELSRYGAVQVKDLSLPVLQDTGIILPGQVLKYTENGNSSTGIVQSVQVTVSMPSVRQSISVISYE